MFFLPIIPTVLLNGGSGIAVGFATNILNRNPINLIDACLKKLEGKRFEDPSPWYLEFNGECIQSPDSHLSWIFRGKYEIKNTSTVAVSELPPSVTYEKFDQHLINIEEKRSIAAYENNCKSNINYTIKFRREDLKTIKDSVKLERLLKMEEKQTENFTVLDENGQLKIFTTAKEIIEYFVDFRLSYYSKRKAHIINKLESELLVLSNRARFIKAIIDGELVVNNVPKSQIILYLETADFDQVDGSYNYLLNMAIHTLTLEKFQELLNQLECKEAELEKIRSIEPIQMYKSDLLELKKALNKTF
jgi:DNA topoisomerase-2